MVDLEERLQLDPVRFGVGSRPFELEVFEGAVWANEPQGSFAAVLRGESITPISKISTLRVGGDEGGDAEGIESVGGADEGDDLIFGQQGDFGLGQDGISLGEGDTGAGGGGGQTDAEGVEEAADVPFDGQLANAPVILDAEVPAPEESEVDELAANFTFSADTVNVGETISFTDTSIGAPTSCNWDFGDGTSASGPEVEKVWTDEGVFTVTLFISDDAGQESSQAFDINILAPDLLRVPTADFSFRSDTIEVDEVLEFFDQSTGDPDLLLWSFGDGTTDTGSVVSHSFAEPGQYIVSLTASNDAGPNTTSATITVVESVSPPQAIICLLYTSPSPRDRG